MIPRWQNRWSGLIEGVLGRILDRILDVDPSAVLWFIASLAVIMTAILLWVHRAF